MHTASRITPLLLVVLALLGMVAPIATDMYLPAFPEVAADLDASAAQVQLTLTAFMLGMAAGQLFWGPVSDRFGRYRPLLVASVVLVAASVVAPLSTGIWMLVVGRFMQGFAGSAGAVIGRAMARDLASGVALAKVFGLLAMIGGLAPILAPVLGGLLVTSVGWQGIMWVIASTSVVILASVVVVVPESLPADRRTPAGLAQVGRSVTSVLGDRAFVGYTLCMILAFGVLFSFISGSSFVLQDQYGLSSSQYSLVFALNATAMVVGGALNTRFVGRLSAQSLLRIGVTALVASTGLLAAVTAVVQQPPQWLFQLLVVVASMSTAPIMANATTLGLSRHGASAGMASAVMGAAQSAAAAAVSPLVSIGGEATALSMAVVMVGCGALSAVAYLTLCARPETPAVRQGATEQQPG